MTSQVDCYNSALTKIGAKRVLSTTDNSKEARECNAVYEDLRKKELRNNRWSFSIKRAQLAALGTTPLFGFGHQYQLPTGCLRVLEVGDTYPGPDMSNYRNGDTAGYAIEGRTIQTDLTAPLSLRYIADIEDTTQWDAGFFDAMAARLAAEVCESITASSQKKNDIMQEYVMALRDARRSNAIERPAQDIADDSWVMVRTRG